MKPRMLCTDCGALDHPNTLLEGSDLVEMAGWLCFALPGWLYCWWRHTLRIKVCRDCGGRELVREARAAAAQNPVPEPESGVVRIVNLAGPVRWPRGLTAPRERLRQGTLAVVLWLACLGSAALSLSGWLPADALFAVAPPLALAGSAWVGRQAWRVARVQPALTACRAWDADGQPLRIEFS